ncbi:MAG: hypothetical protein OEM63_03920 [Gammaproteobacteria bacterium]|nr:hypothetical protein [Gammaproteobacteria bacterium]
MNTEEAIQACKNGAFAAFISAAMTIGVMLFAMNSADPGELQYFNDPLIFIDALLIIGCGIGMLRKSRAASIIILVYFIFAKISIALETGQTSGLGVAFVFLYFYGKAVQGSFNYHKLMKAEDPNHKPAGKWSYILGIPAAVLFFALAGAGLLSTTDYMPSTQVLAGADVSVNDVALLTEKGVLLDDEEIEYFYSYGFSSVLEGGSILSDRAVIIYFEDEDTNIAIYEIEFPDIESIEMIEEGGLFSDSMYMIQGADADDWIVVDLSVENDGHLKFINALNNKIAQSAASL